MPVSSAYATTSFRSNVPSYVSKPPPASYTSSLSRGSRSSYEIGGHKNSLSRDSSYSRDQSNYSRDSYMNSRENSNSHTSYQGRVGEASTSTRDSGHYSSSPSPSSSLRSTSSSSSSSSSSNYGSNNSNNYSSTTVNYNSNYKPLNPYHNISSTISGLSPSSNVTLTRFNRRTDNDSPLKFASGNVLSTPSPSSSLPSTTSSYLTKNKPSYLASTSRFMSSASSSGNDSADENTDNNNRIVIVKPKAPVSGLVNLGNTCYMNSVLQALYSSTLFRSFITKNSSRTPLISALSSLFQDMSDNCSSYSNPSSFRSQFIKYSPKFRGYDQQDSQEFLRYLLNGLHDEVNCAPKSRRPFDPPKSSSEAWKQYRTIDESPIIDMVAGQLSSVITCSICGNVSTCWDPFWDLSLPLPQNLSTCSIERCLKEFTAEEYLDYDEKPTCEKCKKPVYATKKLAIEKAPPILILHLKRFTNDGYKLSRPQINVEETLTIKNKSYNLLASVCHHGSSSKSGHYTCYANYGDGKRWVHCNDQRVTDVRGNDITDQLSDCYILFYKEGTTSSVNNGSTSNGVISNGSISSRL